MGRRQQWLSKDEIQAMISEDIDGGPLRVMGEGVWDYSTGKYEIYTIYGNQIEADLAAVIKSLNGTTEYLAMGIDSTKKFPYTSRAKSAEKARLYDPRFFDAVPTSTGHFNIVAKFGKIITARLTSVIMVITPDGKRIRFPGRGVMA